MPTRRAPSPEPEEVSPLLGGTRGGAKDASERVKAQAVILFWKKVAGGAKKMMAYAFAATKTNNSAGSVRGWVALEEDLGMDGLESRRDACGAVTRYSPSKKKRIDALMDETEGEPTQREVQVALGLGSHSTAATYIEMAGWKKAVKRLKTLLTEAHREARVLFVEKHFEDDFRTTFMGDEKLFVLGLGKKTRYVRREDEPVHAENRAPKPSLGRERCRKWMVWSLGATPVAQSHAGLHRFRSRRVGPGREEAPGG